MEINQRRSLARRRQVICASRARLQLCPRTTGFGSKRRLRNAPLSSTVPLAEVFERLAATAANVPAVLMEQQQKLWDADAKAVARVWENVLNEIVWGDLRPEDNSNLDAADVVAELCRRAGRTQAS